MCTFAFRENATLLSMALLLGACRGSRPLDLGVHGGALAPCPAKPNCVSSEAQDPDHHVAPLALRGSHVQTLQEIKNVVLSMPRTSLVEERENYLAFTFESLIFRFVDDVEFYVPPQAQAVSVRSASRLGHSDLGVNRKRIEAIRQDYERLATAADRK
jgi:uncharacterized protein (DUF1499 family)